LQLSTVQGFWSPHVIALPPHCPPVQRSFCVHALPSLQAFPFAAAALNTQPVAGSQLSTVHGF
jgi:hypothetical protein